MEEYDSFKQRNKTDPPLLYLGTKSVSWDSLKKHDCVLLHRPKYKSQNSNQHTHDADCRRGVETYDDDCVGGIADKLAIRDN